LDANLLALGTDPLVVQVVKAAGTALPPARRAAYGHGAVGANGESACVDGAGLRWAIELELAICDDGAGAAVAVAEYAVDEVADEGRVGGLENVV
jgi:hypothetical protein